jgi:hypothetical protein
MTNNKKEFASCFIKSILGMLLLSSSVFCMESFESKTPTKHSSFKEVDLTAGKMVAQKQKEIFTEENFSKVFSSDELIKLSIDWQIFQVGEFDDSTKRQAVSKISNFMKKKLSTRFDENFIDLNNKILQVVQRQDSVHLQRVDEISSNYFKNKFPEYNIDIDLKSGGVQLGNTVKISKEHERPIIYYVKTHSDGLASGKSSGAKTLNPVELIVYKILEKIGVGCESHFFGRDIRNFYIATRDAGSYGNYLSYEQALSKLKNSEFFDSKDFSNGIFCLDLLSRILRLTDLQTNAGNFGFMHNSDGWHVKAIDFRVTDEKNFIINAEYFKGFLEGNSQINYTDTQIPRIFKNKKSDLSVIARDIFLNQFKNFNFIVEESAKDVLVALKNNVAEELSEENYKIICNTLLLYEKAIKHNFNIFCNELKIPNAVDNE